jgi:glycosyltransferase involved in cell wall biosynthesis
MSTASTVLHLTWLPDPGAWPSIAAKLRQMAARGAAVGVEVCALTMRGEVGGQVRTTAIAPGRFARIRRGHAIADLLERHQDACAILRWPGALDPGMGRLLRHHGHRLVTEHHTDENAELRLLARSPWLLARAAAERWWTPRLLAQAAGIIGVTDELRQRLQASSGSTPAIAVGNGIAVDDTPFTGFRPFTGEALELVFSAARFWPWQGLDRILAGLQQHRGPLRVILHLLGNAVGFEQMIARCRSAAVKVVCHGLLDGTQADSIYRSAHLGISTLALHRKGMAEACPLKSREYCARGLPFVHAYHDPDLTPTLPWAHALDADDGPITVDALIDAVLCSRTIRPMAIREWAADHLDWMMKLGKMGDFARKVACAPVSGEGTDR